jgi:predicted nucleotidyltransferase
MNTIADLSRDELLQILRRLEPALRAKGVIELAMFGSRARGDHRPDSDVDLLVAVKSGIKFSLLDLVGVSHIISDEIGVPANLFMKRSLDPTMAATIRADLLEVF